ncbi:hypothetical protein CEUSTIGMA_g5159.t1 [Chlamydomonas eustigma]|uniref:Kinesin-associated protein 3 n=1 Tax=Chlamydomonas eustigma TaxID=1157962 RepID=A0A250X3T5_9CHLO|nr:hypothetical protein CEUSTIGMA_g5159.t1 [Chlamydomonas eustigma]|eukprot:GAX77716.1 hypothetical protein CEUSTIGMA_g5159.t1 [Chlamydomonas eustigma]
MTGEVKKKIKPGSIELHPEELAIVVNYEVQEVSVETQQVLSREQAVKKISVKTLTDKTNVPLLAGEIVEKCKLIHPSKTGHVEELLYQLQQRQAQSQSPTKSAAPQPAQQVGNGRAAPAPTSPQGGSQQRRMNRVEADAQEAAELRARQQMQASQIFKAQQKQYEQAYLEHLDEYMEDLYEEDMSKKVRATGMISQLFRKTENFETLLSHETLLQTLSRLMREEMKRSIDLCINIVSVYFSISNFSQFHPVIMDNQIGALTMDLIDLEIKRTEHRAAEEGISPAMVAQKALDASTGQVQLQEREKKLLALIQKQDRLLYLCFYLLLNLAEDVGVEKKMKKKNIVVYLVKMLDRSNVELLILGTTFLKKLSIYKENKEKMAECRIVDKLAKFVPVRNDVLLMSVLRLLHNLSFDVQLRDDMVKNGLIPKCVDLMSQPRFQPVVLGLLYHVSMEDKYKGMFTYTDCIPRIYEMLTRVQELRNTPELIALAVNLTQNPRNAEVMCEGDRFDKLIRRAFQTCDELAFKVLRNLSQQENFGVKRRFGPYIEQMVMLLKAPDITAELFVEVLGSLANLYIPEFDFLGLVRKHDLLQFLATYSQPGAVDDDILLEVVMFVGVLCNEGTAPLLVQSGLVNTLFVLMGEKKEDDEFVLQIAFSFNKFLMYDDTRLALLNYTQVVFYLIDLLQDKNKEVQKVADQCLDIIMDTDEEWAVRIRNLKFEAFNQEWLEVVQAPPDQVMAGRHPGGGNYGMDSGEVDYNDVGDYTIGGQRVMADFDDFAGGGQQWSPGQDNYGYEQDAGQYDEEELRRGYQM